MLHYYKFAEDVPAPVPARDAYEKREPGRGWPEECPPLRAANGFGWDVLAAFDMAFVRDGEGWRLEEPRDVESDWTYEPDEGEAGESSGAPLVQRNAWFWDEDQELPHRISPHVYARLRHQVKVSSYLFLATDPNELLYMTDVPNRQRPFRAMSCVLDTDWYPASYPWHCVLELDAASERVEIAAGEPICRLFLVRRESYFAREMSTDDFGRFFQRGQSWLARYGRGDSPDMLDITKVYGKQQRRATFDVMP